MPGSTLPNTGVVLPSLGGDAGTWGTEVNAALTNYDGHNHTTGSGAPIPVSALNINADIPFSALYGPTAMGRAQFSAVAAPASPTNNLSFFVSDGTGGLTAGELYWRNNTGNFIRVTSGNSLNFAAFVGGIGGDYTAVSASEAFDDSQKQYTFKDGTAKWARLHAGNVRFAPFGTTSVNFIEMAAPGGLAGNYTFTLPASLPASGSRWLLLTSAGQVSTSVTINVPVKNGSANGGAVADGVLTIGASPSYITVPLLIGLTAVSFTITYNPSGASTQVSSVKTSATGSVTTTSLFTDNVSGWKTSSTNTLASTVGANEFYEIKVSGSGSVVSGVSVTYA